jgi:hypothetical protein
MQLESVYPRRKFFSRGYIIHRKAPFWLIKTSNFPPRQPGNIADHFPDTISSSREFVAF